MLPQKEKGNPNSKEIIETSLYQVAIIDLP